MSALQDGTQVKLQTGIPYIYRCYYCTVILTQIFRGIPQSLLENARMLSRLDRLRFTNHFQCCE
jgi:hypothetical protein